MAAFPKQLIQAVLKKNQKNHMWWLTKAKLQELSDHQNTYEQNCIPMPSEIQSIHSPTVYAMRHETYENVRNHYFYAFLYPCWCCGCVHVPLWEFHCHYIASWSRDFRCQYMKSKCRATKPWSHSLLRLKTLYLWKLPVHQQSIRLNQGRKEKLKSF